MKRICAFLLSMLMVIAMMPSVALAASYRYATEPVMFRTGPSTDYAIITELQTGDRVEFLGTSGNWSKVKWNGRTGYVFSKYLSTEQATSATYRYATEPVNMRSGPSTRYSVITELKTGERVEYLGVSGSWTKVKWNGKTGYVYTKYLSSATGISASGPNIAAGRFATATGNNINVRSGPGTSYRKLGTVKKGQTVPVVDISSDWLKIDWNNGNAYVHSRYFTLSQMQNGVSIVDALSKNGYFKTNASIFLGTFIDSKDVLNIRVSKGANTSKVNRELKTLMSGATGYYRVVSSSLPSYVNEEYIKDLLDTINQRYARLSSSEKARCDFSGAYYDAAKDQFIVEIIDLNNAKKQYFKQHILNWSSITFKSVESLAVPKV